MPQRDLGAFLTLCNGVDWLVDRPARMDTLRLLIGLMPRAISDTVLCSGSKHWNVLSTLAAMLDLAAKVGRQDLGRQDYQDPKDHPPLPGRFDFPRSPGFSHSLSFSIVRSL